MKSFILGFLMMSIAVITYAQDAVSWHYSAQAMYAAATVKFSIPLL